MLFWCSFFFNDTATTEIYTLSLHDALPILKRTWPREGTWTLVIKANQGPDDAATAVVDLGPGGDVAAIRVRSEEHTSELQSPCNLVCRLLLEKKKQKDRTTVRSWTTVKQRC